MSVVVYCTLVSMVSYSRVYGLLLPCLWSPTPVLTVSYLLFTPSPHHPHHTNPHRSHPHATTHSTNIVSYPAIYARNHTLQSYTIPAAEIPTTYSSTLVICTLSIHTPAETHKTGPQAPKHRHTDTQTHRHSDTQNPHKPPRQLRRDPQDNHKQPRGTSRTGGWSLAAGLVG